MKEILNVENLSYLNIFSNLNISFPKEEFISISGPNNCGKTTLIRILSGQIFIKDKLIFNNEPVNERNIDKFLKKVKCIIPTEINFLYNSLEEEILNYLNKQNKEEYNCLLKEFNLTTYKDLPFSTLKENILIKIKLLLILLENPEIIILDDLGCFFNKQEFLEVIKVIKKYQAKKQITIIMTTSNLEETLYANYLYVISGNSIYLQGPPLEVLQKDNLLNKIGLDLPFMIDLSVKLKDYELVKNIELDMNRMVNLLWK